MNAKKGCFRIVIALSLLASGGGFARMITAVNDGQAQAGLAAMIGGPVVVLAVSLIVWWIVKGFNESS